MISLSQTDTILSFYLRGQIVSCYKLLRLTGRELSIKFLLICRHRLLKYLFNSKVILRFLGHLKQYIKYSKKLCKGKNKSKCLLKCLLNLIIIINNVVKYVQIIIIKAELPLCFFLIPICRSNLFGTFVFFIS